MISKLLGGATAALVIVASWIAWSLFQGFVLGNCDPKFGCLGGVWLAASISSIAGAISALAFVIASSLLMLIQPIKTRAQQIGAGAFGGFLLTFLLPTMRYWQLEMSGMVAGWFGLSLVVFLVMLLVQKSVRSEGT